MKKFKFSIAWLAMFALIFTSCSKEETDPMAADQDLIQLTFGSVLNDMNNDLKQAAPAECREGNPAYVLVGITDAAGNYVGDDGGTTDVNLIEVGIKWNTAMNVWETIYSEELALPAGDYELEHFIVYDSSDQVLWVAPRTEGTFGDYVDNALPQPIELREGTKPYITVDVLCFISRNEEAYGYLFFDINLIEVENSYCIFVNYCDDETGREYPAYFSIEVWADAIDGQQAVNLNNDTNTITFEGGDEWPSASVLCFALPDLGDETYYARVTVMNHDDLDYTADATDTYEFEITQADIDAQEIFVPAYEHVRINCDDDPDGGGEDPDCDIDVACGLNLDSDLDDYCYYTFLEGANESGWVQINDASDLQLLADVGGPDSPSQLAAVEVSLTAEDGISVVLDTPIGETDRITAYAIEVRPDVNGTMSTTCWESECANIVAEYGEIENEFSGFTYSYPFYLRVNTVNCFEPDVLE